MPKDTKVKTPPWFDPRLEDIIIPKEMYTALPAHIIQRLRQQLVDNYNHHRPSGIKNWEEIVTLDGLRYALLCCPDSEGKIIMKGARKAKISRL